MKRLIAVFVFVAFATVAFANPFSDVPFTHWAYDAVAKLTASGVITGFPDGAFKGNKTMTRYELAMVVARLMARLEDSKGNGISRGDYATLERLTVEFADELALLGVKVMALEDEVAMVRDDVASLKKAQMSCGGNVGKIKISGEYRAQYNQLNFDSRSGSYVTKSTIGGVAVPALGRLVGDSAQENLQQMMRLYIDTPIDEDVSYHIALEYGYNSWGSGAAGTEDNYNTGFEVKKAYVKVNDFFGWADVMKIGRQTMKHAHDLLYSPVEMDGIYVSKAFSGCFSCNHDRGPNHMKRFKLSSYAVASPNAWAEDNGLNLWSVVGDWNLKEFHMSFYYMAKSDHNNIHNPGGRSVLAGGNLIGAEYTNDGQYEKHDGTYTTNYQDRWRDVNAVEYIGLAIHGDLYNDLYYYGELASMDWKENVLDPNQPDGNTTLKAQVGYNLGIEWKAAKAWKLGAHYRRHGKYFEPATAGVGVFNNGLHTELDFGADEGTQWSSLGYTRDFSDVYLRADYKINKKAAAFAGYEMISDNRDNATNEFADDIVVASIGLKYFYKSNTFFQIAYYHFNGEDAKNNSFASNSVGATGKIVVPATQNLHIGQLAGVEEDQSLLRMEMQVRF